jgi:hypothetical protein
VTEALASLSADPGTARSRYLSHLEREPSLVIATQWLAGERFSNPTPKPRVQAALEQASAPLKRYRCAACGFEAGSTSGTAPAARPGTATRPGGSKSFDPPPRRACSASPPQGGDTSGPAKPVPTVSLEGALRSGESDSLTPSPRSACSALIATRQ